MQNKVTKANLKKYLLPALLVFGILLIDQIIKIRIKTTMHLGQEIPVFGNWFIIHFTENKGMALGLEIAGQYGKLILSILRILAVGLIGWYLTLLIKKNENTLYVISITLILAGAIGNIIDSCFYGLIFTESYPNVAHFVPFGEGYAPFLFGKVVDMFYFPIIDTTLPSWLPIWGGKEFQFFSFIFNFADAAVTIGVFMLLVRMMILSGKKKKESQS